MYATFAPSIKAFAKTNIEFVEILRSVATIAIDAFADCASLKGARVYSTSAFKAVTNGTGILPKVQPDCGAIYTDTNFYNLLTLINNSETYLSYKIIVEDMFEIFDNNLEYLSCHSSLQDAQF